MSNERLAGILIGLLGVVLLGAVAGPAAAGGVFLMMWGNNITSSIGKRP